MVKVTAFVPSDKTVPATGLCVTVSGPLQSVATTPAVRSGRTAWHMALADRLPERAHAVRPGGVRSTTVMTAEQLTLLLAASWTRNDTKLEPRPSSVPGAGV